MRFDVRPAGLPRLQVQVDLEPRLILTVSVRDLDEDGAVAIRAGLTICTPQELEELLLGLWVHLNPHGPPYCSLWVMPGDLSSSRELQGKTSTRPGTLTT